MTEAAQARPRRQPGEATARVDTEHNFQEKFLAKNLVNSP